MYPLRGALVRAINDGSRMPKVDEAHCVPHPEGSTDQDMVFIVPRGESMLLLGGLTEEDEWSLDIGLHNYQPIRDMYRRCLDFMPILARGEIDPGEPVRAGLRPLRNGNVCLEREEATSIVHNYGHGGSGFSFSWGCAREVTAKVTGAISDVLQPA
jgi:D-amino-acid oxidase